METTDTQRLPFPECVDPGVGALDLQVLAEAIDAKLVTAFANFRAVVNRPAFIVGLSANQTGFASGSPGQDITWSTTIWNSTVALGIGAGVLFYEPGYWMLGTWVSASPSGGTTANSRYSVRLTYQGALLTPIGGESDELVGTINYQSSTGGEDQVVTHLVRQEFNDTTSFSGGGHVSVNIYHENVASTLTVTSTSIVWGFKVSDLEDS